MSVLLEWLARHTRPCIEGASDATLAAFTTDAIAADAADIVRLLGHRSVNLFGSSFGSRVALAYAGRTDPDLVRSVVLEGPYPPDVDGGAVVFFTISAEDGQVWEATVVRIGFDR